MPSLRRGAPAALLATVLLAAAAVPIAVAPAAAQQSEQKDDRITVSGTASVSAAPDTALLDLGVVAEADTADAALAQNSQATAKVVAAVKAAGIAAIDVQTSGFSVYPRYVDRRDDDEPPRMAGYTVRNGVVVRVRTLGDLGKLLDAAVKAGANQVNGITFLLKDDGAVRDQARAGAVRDARRKAEIYAAAAGAKIGKVIAIWDTGTEAPARPMMRMMAGGEADLAYAPEPPIETGTVEISAYITVVFALEPGGP